MYANHPSFFFGSNFFFPNVDHHLMLYIIVIMIHFYIIIIIKIHSTINDPEKSHQFFCYNFHLDSNQTKISRPKLEIWLRKKPLFTASFHAGILLLMDTITRVFGELFACTKFIFCIHNRKLFDTGLNPSDE